MVTIAVHGTATRSIAPERAVLTVVASASGADRSDVVGRVAAQHDRLSTEAAALESAGAATSWHSSGLSSGIVWDWRQTDGSSERVRSFRADAEVTVTFAYVPELSRWLVDVAQREDVEVRGVRWELTDATRTAALRQLRSVAVTDAATRAVDLADAAGLGTPRLGAIYEEGLRPGSGEDGAQPVRFARAMSADAAGPTLDLHPQPIELAVTVTADFVTDPGHVRGGAGRVVPVAG